MIITRGFGYYNLIIARGFGFAFLVVGRIKEIVRFASKVTTVMRFESWLGKRP